MKQQPKSLRQVSTTRVVGFSTAVRDLGTHTLCGVQVPYTAQQVRKVLSGMHQSKKLLELIAKNRPDLFSLHYVCEDVRQFAINKGITL